MRLSPTEELVNQVVELKYEDLPDDVILTAKKATLDTLACIVAGSKYASVPETVGLFKKWGGTKEATILVYGDKVPAPHAAFANGVMSRAIDMGDFHPLSSHVSEYIVTAMLAMAELQGGASGREFITAYVAGAEPSHRIAAAVGGTAETVKRGRYLATGGKFGTTLAAAKLHRLNKEQTANALGLAYIMSFPWGNAMVTPVGNATVYFEHGYQCQCSIEHALLAELGVTGPKEILAGTVGVFNQFLPWREVDPESIMADWGKKWQTTETVIKRYPSCGYTLTPIQVMLDIMAGSKISAEDIASIQITISPAAHEATGKPEKWHPKDEREAKFSMPFVVATAAIKQKVFVDDLTPQEMARSDIRELMSRITLNVDREISGGAVFSSATITVKLKNGQELVKEAKQGKSVDWDELTEKARRCVSLSAKPFPENNLAQLAEKIQNLEDIADITTLIPLLTP